MNKRIFALFLCVTMVFVGCSKVDDEIDFAEANTTTSQKIKSIENENQIYNIKFYLFGIAVLFK